MNAIPVVEELKALVSDQPQNPLRPNQIVDFTDEMARQEQMATAPPYVTGQSRGMARRRAQELKRLLEAQAPKKITGDRADAVARKLKEVIETVIRPALLPRSALRRNPPGAVGHLLRTEFKNPFKEAVLTVKRAMRGLDPDNADPDYTSMERFRPEGTGDGTASFMADAQIPGFMALSEQAKQNWPLGEPTANTALAQVKRREKAEEDGRKPVSPARLRALERGRVARAKNLAARKAKQEAVASTG